MKKTYVLAALSLMSIVSTKAQDDPESRFLFEHLWTSIADHDSIVYYSDTGMNSIPEYITEFTFFSDGNIDTATSYSYPSTVPGEAYKGVQTAYGTDIAYLDVSSGSVDTIAKYIIIKDQNSRDSAMQVFHNDGSGTLIMSQEYRSIYHTNNTLDKLEIYSSDSTDLTLSAIYDFHYTGLRLDSMVLEITFLGIGVPAGVFDNHYDTNDKLIYSDIIAIDPFERTRTIESRAEFAHNNSNEIERVFISYYDSTASQWELEETWHYLTKESNTSFLKEDVSSVSIYPNPVKDILNISEPQNFSSFEIIQTNGMTIKKGTLKGQIDLSSLPNGIFILKLTGNDKSINVQKIQKL